MNLKHRLVGSAVSPARPLSHYASPTRTCLVQLARPSQSYSSSFSTVGIKATQAARTSWHTKVAAAFAASSFSLALLLPTTDAHADQPAGPRYIRLSDVKDHDRDATSVWVTRGNRVYDITNWIANHPGGDVILRAAGGSIDQYWKLFAIHQKQDVYDILEQYYLGDIDPRDLVNGVVPEDSIVDPFSADPERDPRLVVHTARPCNAETPGEELGEYITPNCLFYVRNHMWVPEEHEDDHKVTIELEDGEEKVYTMRDLREKFEKHTVTALLQCSGNRRSHMSKESRPTSGLPWDVGAIGNATWAGARLRDVLQDAGFDVDKVPEDVNHVQFAGSEAYAASIPIEKAVDKTGDVILAYEMNGETLPRDHGYPIRALVPGVVAARSVKWVNRIALSEEESTSQWQRRDYKCFGPNVPQKEADWDSAPSIQETPVQSAVTCVRNGGNGTGQGADNAISFEGYAFSGGGRKIIRVDVSSDGGKTWKQAELQNDESFGQKTWSWQRWKFEMDRNDAQGPSFVVKATDDGYNTQPESHEATWNFRGNLAVAWHKFPLEHVEKNQS